MKSRFQIAKPDGTVVGDVAQKNMLGKIRFSLNADGREVGTLNAENWRAWNFNIQDASGTEVARITKTWEGLAKTVFTDGGQLCRRVHRADRGAVAQPRRRVRAVRRHGPQAGLPRLQLRDGR